jgi:hypothetical protein
MQRFRHKKEAESYLDKHKKLKLYGEDISCAGHKAFIACDSEYIYNRIMKEENNYYYEYFLNYPVNFILDMDIPSNKIEFNNINRLLESTILKIIHFAKYIYNFKYNINDFIVLETNKLYQDEKYSYHIICRGLVFPSGETAKDFFNMINNSKYKLNYCDGSIYTNCLRMALCSKKGKNAKLYPIQLKIKEEYTLYGTDYNFWLKTSATYVEDERFRVKPIKKINKTVNIDKPKNSDIKNILDKLPEKYYNDYDEWIRIGMMLHNSGESFDLWNNWSKKSDKYKEKNMKKLWDGFEKDVQNKLTIGSLIKIAQDLGIIKKKKNIKEIILEYPERPVTLNETNAIILNQNKLTPDIYNLNKKLIAIQSEKGTGKTSNLLEKLFASNKVTNYTRILIVSSRRTLGIKFLGDLSKYNFKLYSEIEEPDIRDTRIICQLDSLLRLKLSKYDIIIVDECESMARYLTSIHFKKNNKSGFIVNMFEYYINNAKNVYILDADLSDRCLNYYKKLCDTQDKNIDLIINKHKPYEEYTVVSMEYELWLNKILDYVNNNKKIVIAMTSNNKAKDLKILIENNNPDKKILIIHKETTDDQKMEYVKNVNEQWQLYDIILYTPSVNMGISFDIVNYFDCIFGYGCSNSVGGQEFTQMLHRVREPKEKNIYIAIDNFQEFKKEDLLTYNEISEILCTDYYLTKYDLHTSLITPKPKYDATKDEKILTYPYSNEPIYDLIVRNTWELIENKQNFAATFYGYIKHKGYKLTYDLTKIDESSILEDMKNIRNIRESDELDATINGILEAKELTTEEYMQLITTKDTYLTEEERCAIRKYNLRKCYHHDGELNEEFIERYNDNQKMMWHKNISTISKSENQDTNDKIIILKDNQVNATWNDNCYLDLTSKNLYMYHKYVLDIIDSFKFDINNLNKQLNEDEYKKGLTTCISWLEYVKNTVFMHFNIKLTKTKLIDMKESEQLKYVNNILHSMYGLTIKKNKKVYQMIDNDYWIDLPNRKVTIIDL